MNGHDLMKGRRLGPMVALAIPFEVHESISAANFKMDISIISLWCWCSTLFPRNVSDTVRQLAMTFFTQFSVAQQPIKNGGQLSSS